MRGLEKAVWCLVLGVLAFSACACGREGKGATHAALYGDFIGKLGDEELFAIVEAGASSPILLVTSKVYDDGRGNQAAMKCDVYYRVDGKVEKAGTLESQGTAYPVSFDGTGLYAASGHGMQRFQISEKDGGLILAEGVYEQIDKKGDSVYTMEKRENKKTIAEEEYLLFMEQYGEASVVSFAYGASDQAHPN